GYAIYRGLEKFPRLPALCWTHLSLNNRDDGFGKHGDVAALRNRDSGAGKVKSVGQGPAAVQRIAIGWEEGEGTGSDHLIGFDGGELEIHTGAAFACIGEAPVDCPGRHKP